MIKKLHITSIQRLCQDVRLHIYRCIPLLCCDNCVYINSLYSNVTSSQCICVYTTVCKRGMYSIGTVCIICVVDITCDSSTKQVAVARWIVQERLRNQFLHLSQCQQKELQC